MSSYLNNRGVSTIRKKIMYQRAVSDCTQPMLLRKCKWLRVGLSQAMESHNFFDE